MAEVKDLFLTDPGFCSDCGSILPNLKASGDLTCYLCEKIHSAAVFKDLSVKYTIHFNSVEVHTKNLLDEQRRKEEEADSADGPVIERKCPKCANDRMSYATLQLRSADEGQTVFFTCTKCKYKESENS